MLFQRGYRGKSREADSFGWRDGENFLTKGAGDWLAASEQMVPNGCHALCPPLSTFPFIVSFDFLSIAEKSSTGAITPSPGKKLTEAQGSPTLASISFRFNPGL